MEAKVQTEDLGEDVFGATAAKVMMLEHQTGAASSSAAAAASSSSPSVRVVLQQCMSAQLMVQPAAQGEEPHFVEIQRGVILYVCFLKGATKADIEKMAKMVLGVRLSETNNGKLTSVGELPGDILIIPQATLGGTIKGKLMQYHKNIAKDEGMRLYSEFVAIFRKTYEKSDKCLSAGAIVRHGTYGNRQVFSCQTNGPYTHLIEV